MPEPRQPGETDAQVLARLEIRTFDEDLFSMSAAAARRNFTHANGAFDVGRYLYNLIWNDRLAILRGDLDPVQGNIRSYWYQRVKPLFSRVEVPGFKDKYPAMITQMVDLVVDQKLMRYGDFGFRDEGLNNRKIGDANPHIIVASEKLGHLPLLEELGRDYGVTYYALGGQPSVLSKEYFLREYADAGFTDRPIHVFTIVDFDPAGHSIAENFYFGLQVLGYQGEIHPTALVHPSHMTARQIALNKYGLPQSNAQKTRTDEWIRQTGGLRPFGDTSKFGQGLEADSMSWAQLTEVFDDQVEDLLIVPRDTVIRRRRKRELVDVLTQHFVRRAFG